MKKLEITGKETDKELAVIALTVFADLCSDIIGDAVEMAQGNPKGLKELVETQLRAQEQGPGAMKAHFLYYAISILPVHDQTCLLSNLFQGANMEEVKKKAPVIWLPTKGNC